MAITPELETLIKNITTECERLTMTNIEVYNVQGLSPLTDMIVIATASHILQLDAARKQLSFMAKQAGYPIQNPTEDYSEGWLAMDFDNLVVHILVEDKRAFYDLDGLMESISKSRSVSQNFEDDDDELTEQDIEAIISQLTPEEAEEFLSKLADDSEEDDDEI